MKTRYFLVTEDKLIIVRKLVMEITTYQAYSYTFEISIKDKKIVNYLEVYEDCEVQEDEIPEKFLNIINNIEL